MFTVKSKRNTGNAKTQVIRIKPVIREDLKMIRGLIGLPSYCNEGDVVEALIRIFKKNKVDNPSFLVNSPLLEKEIPNEILDSSSLIKDREEYKNLYENQCRITGRWKKRFDKVCEENKLDKNKILSLPL